MKTLLVHFVKNHGEGRIEIAGRCASEPIAINDELQIEGRASSRLRVVSIEVYGKQVELLHTGYVGNLFVQMIDVIEPIMKLTG